MFSNAFQARLSVEFHFILKSWSSNSCAICGPTKIPSLFLASLWVIFAQYIQTLHFLYPPLSQIFISNWTWYTVKVNIVLT